MIASSIFRHYCAKQNAGKNVSPNRISFLAFFSNDNRIIVSDSVQTFTAKLYTGKSLKKKYMPSCHVREFFIDKELNNQ